MTGRITRIMSLVTAAAAAFSIIPYSAYAADKLKEEKGTIYNAVSYKDGKIYIDGEPAKKDESVYYFNSGKYSELKKVDTESDISIYGSKYVNIDNGDYYLDLSTGKLTEDDIEEDSLDEASESLRKKVKDDNDKRYENNDSKNYKTLTVIPGHKFSDIYYKTQYKTYKSKNSINGGAAEFTVYTNGDGKYIDADYNLGTIKVKLDGGSTVKIANTSKDDDDVRAYVYDTQEIGQDSDYIYRTASLCVDSSEASKKISEINGLDVNEKSDYFQIESEGKKIDFKVIQAISKDQASGNVDGIKYAETVYNYFLTDEDGDKFDLLNNSAKNFSAVSKDKIINYSLSGNTVSTQVLNLKTKGSLSYIDAEDGDDIDLNDEEKAFDIDSKGNLWALSDDYIYKFNNKGDWEKEYKVSDDFIALNVYDKDNLIAWNEDDEIYSIAYSQEASSSNDTSDDTNSNNNSNDQNNAQQTVLRNWQLDLNGKWSFYKEDGTKATGWYKDGSTWYYMDGNGIMQTGWVKSNGTWYYLKESGAMATGWINDRGTWYYLNSAGAMLYNTTVDGYKLGPTGAWIK